MNYHLEKASVPSNCCYPQTYMYIVAYTRKNWQLWHAIGGMTAIPRIVCEGLSGERKYHLGAIPLVS